MKLGLIYNEYLKSNTYISNIEKYFSGISASGINVTKIPVHTILGSTSTPTFDACVFLDKDTATAEYLEESGIKVLNSSKNIRICDDKALTYAKLLPHNIKMPETIVSPFVFGNQKTTLNIPFKYPYIIKEVKGSWGDQVYLIKSQSELNEILNKINSRFLVQEYIKGGNSDIRVITVGGKAICSMKRTNFSDFRSNAEQGGICENCTPPQSVIELAEKVSEILKLDFAGIDIILDNDIPYLIEVNSNPFINQISKVTGIDIGRKIGEYIKDVQI